MLIATSRSTARGSRRPGRRRRPLPGRRWRSAGADPGRHWRDGSVFDNSPAQLAQDEHVAQRDGLAITHRARRHARPRPFADGSFDLVVNPVSNVFLPRPAPGLARVQARPASGRRVAGRLHEPRHLRLRLTKPWSSARSSSSATRCRPPTSPTSRPRSVRGCSAPTPPWSTATPCPTRRRPARRRVRHHRLRRSAAPRLADEPVHAGVLRDAGGPARLSAVPAYAVCAATRGDLVQRDCGDTTYSGTSALTWH